VYLQLFEKLQKKCRGRWSTVISFDFVCRLFWTSDRKKWGTIDTLPLRGYTGMQYRIILIY